MITQLLSYRQTLVLSIVVGLEVTAALLIGYALGYIDKELEGVFTLDETPRPEGPNGGVEQEIDQAGKRTAETSGFPIPATAGDPANN